MNGEGKSHGHPVNPCSPLKLCVLSAEYTFSVTIKCLHFLLEIQKAIYTKYKYWRSLKLLFNGD